MRKDQRKMTIEERLERLTGIVQALASSTAARDAEIETHTNQLGVLIDLAATRQKGE